MVSDKVREAFEARQRAMRAEDMEEERKKAAPMTDRQIANLKMELARSMLPGESVSAAMKRVRGAGGGGVGRVKREVKREGETLSGGNMDLFLRMTEIVDVLFSEGETEVFTCDKEELEKSASMWLPKVAASTAATQARSRAQDDDGDDDMFGDEDGQAKDETCVINKPEVKEEAEPPGISGHTAGDVPGTDYSSWPVKEISRFLKENGVDPSGIVEKGELVSLAQKTEKMMRKEAEEALKTSQLNTTAPNVPPPGYVFHPESGFYHNAESQMYFDSNSGAFWDGSRWLAFDGKAYVPLKS